MSVHSVQMSVHALTMPTTMQINNNLTPTIMCCWYEREQRMKHNKQAKEYLYSSYLRIVVQWCCTMYHVKAFLFRKHVVHFNPRFSILFPYQISDVITTELH